MLTKEGTYRKAFEIKKNTLKQKIRQRTVMLNAAYHSNPRLKDIDNELASVGAQLAITAISGDTAKLADLKKRSEALSAEKSVLLEKAQVEDIKFDCALCEDTGYVNGKICDCVKLIAKKLTVNELSKEIPIEECRFDNFDLKYYQNQDDANGNNPRRRMTAIFKLCVEYARNFDPKSSKNLLFMGQAGLGKTHLTMAIVSAVIEKGFIPIYGSAENLFTKLENERFSNNESECYDAMIHCDLLVIDDLGTEFSTSFTKAALYHLINTRLLSKKPTIINTNLSMKEIENVYTARVASRLIGNYDANRFLGNDIRQQKALNR